MSCARCGCGVYKTEDFISLNKMWHTNCFTCDQCNTRLNKNTAKVFQGELFCQSCYSCMIETFFEVVSTPSVPKSTKVMSSPRGSVNKTCIETLKQSCCLLQENLADGKTTGYGSLALKNSCPPRSGQSCNCISNECTTKNLYCYVFPITKKASNYNNRSHIQTKIKNPAMSCIQSRCPAYSCRKCCSNEVARCPIQIPTLKPQCCCNSSAAECSPPEKFCCLKPHHPSCSVVLVEGCAHCCEAEDDFIEPCIVRCCKPKHRQTPWSCPPIECCESKCAPKTGGAPSPSKDNSPPPPPKCPGRMESCCGQVYAAEKTLVSSGAYHASCFTCNCCNKSLDMKKVNESCGEIYCKSIQNS